MSFFRQILIVLTILSISFVGRAAEHNSFSAIESGLRALSEDPQAEVFLRIYKDRFEIVSYNRKEISEDVFDKVLHEKSIPGIPTLKLSADSDELVFQLSGDDELIKPLLADGTSSKKFALREATVLETHKREEWRDFIAAAVNEGLLTYVSRKSADAEVVEFRFRNKLSAPAFVSSKGIQLSEEFYNWMQVSLEHPPSEGSNGFVVLVHEPHSNVVGQQQLLKGLQSLQLSNKRSMAFLVEGQYENSSRRIEFNGLDTELDQAARKGSTLESLVNSLVSMHLVNGPMAYCLLYDRNLPMYAIDDKDALKRDVGGYLPGDKIKELKAILAIAESLERKAQQEKDEDSVALVNQLVVVAMAYSTADLSQTHGQQLVDYYETLSAIISQIASLSTAEKSIRQQAAYLKSQAKAYKQLQETYQAAVDRDATMAEQIRLRATSSPDLLSVAFIGNFHTSGVTQLLRKSGVGYIVVEPRIQGFDSREELTAFQEAIHSKTRPRYLKRIQNLNMGPTSPTRAEVTKHFKKYLAWQAKRSARQVKKQENSLGKISSSLETDRLRDALQSNSTLSMVEIDSIASGGHLPPPPSSLYADAFAFFEPNSRNHGAKFVLQDVSASAWSDGARYRFLENAVIIPSVKMTENLDQHAMAVFFTDRKSHRAFATVKDPSSNRYYFMEADKALDVIDNLGPPSPKKGEDIRAHIRFSELLRMLFPKEQSYV
jgi:hypothetical protein